jgi:4,5-dihydroxyphthalate decarboxylase
LIIHEGKLHLTWGTGDYELVAPLVNGEVQPEGIVLNPIMIGSPERHWRMMRHHEFDLCELSMSSYLMMSDQGSDVIAIPVFAHRRFRHSYIFVNKKQIQKPKDLIGKKIGLRTFQATAGVWARGILEEEYGVPLSSIEWFTQDEEDIPFEAKADMVFKRLPKDANIDKMLQDGEIQAIIYPETIPSVAKGVNGAVGRLFDNYKEVEAEYYQRTGIFPIMHTVVLTKLLAETHPWVPYSLLKAFRKSLSLCYQKTENPRRYALAWVMELLEEQKRFLGKDPWKFDFHANKDTIEKLISYSYNQGMIKKKLIAEELFATSTLDEMPYYV